MPPGGIRTHNLSRQVAAYIRLRLRGHWDRPFSLWAGGTLIIVVKVLDSTVQDLVALYLCTSAQCQTQYFQFLSYNSEKTKFYTLITSRLFTGLLLPLQ